MVDRMPTIGWAPDQPNIVTGLDPYSSHCSESGHKGGGRRHHCQWPASAFFGSNGPGTAREQEQASNTPGFYVATRSLRLRCHRSLPSCRTSRSGTASVLFPSRRTSTSFHSPRRFPSRSSRTGNTSLLILELVEKMLQRKVSVKQMSGPIGIAQASGDAARQEGWTPLLR